MSKNLALDATKAASPTPALLRELKQLLVESLCLEHDADNIADDCRLFDEHPEAESLGLDSIEALMIVAEVEQKYGRMFDPLMAELDRKETFASVRSLATFVSNALAEQGLAQGGQS